MTPVTKRAWRRLCSFAGFDPERLVGSLQGVTDFLNTWKHYNQNNRRPAFRATWRDLYPILNERAQGAGTAGGHYFHQDLWAARKILARRPPRHLDIGSRIDGFVAHLLVFMPVTVVDIRPIEGRVKGLTFIQDDATELSAFHDDSVESLSSLHAAEHFGLGRYSDAVDPEACFRFMQALGRVLSPNGRLYFSVPIGRERVEFNAHRVFAVRTILSSFARLQLVSFSFVGEDDRLYEDVDPSQVPAGGYACGLFEFTKATAEPLPPIA